jgi:hypothetical protein
VTEPLPEESRQAALQRDVQRLLGRCLLRMQQYEVLLKAMLAHQEVSGSIDTLDAQRAARAEKLADKSLGTLVKALFQTYVVPPGFERELLPKDETAADRMSVALSLRLEMSLENLDETKAAVKDLVELRNQLVHHLIERFDLFSELGCVDAVRHLEESYGRIDQHFLQLSGWAEASDKARAKAAQFTRSPEFRDMLVNGIAPDGTFDWAHTGIVRVLREAAKELATQGWTRLDSACTWIADKHPEQVPHKYGCWTWRQVLSESRQFELQYRLESNGTKVACFRERSSAFRTGPQAPD